VIVIYIALINLVCHNAMFCGTFLVGRYNKFSRTLSQTPWVIDGQRRMESSVQEIISESLQTASKAERNLWFFYFHIYNNVWRSTLMIIIEHRHEW